MIDELGDVVINGYLVFFFYWNWVGRLVFYLGIV